MNGAAGLREQVAKALYALEQKERGLISPWEEAIVSATDYCYARADAILPLLAEREAALVAATVEECALEADKEAAVPYRDGGTIARTDACVNVANAIRSLHPDAAALVERIRASARLEQHRTECCVASERHGSCRDGNINCPIAESLERAVQGKESA